MDNNELRDAIEGTLEHTCCEDFETQATSILSLIAPILADAEKWRVLEKKYPNFCKRFDVTIDALEGEEEKNEQDKNDADALKDAMDDMRQHGDY